MLHVILSKFTTGKIIVGAYSIGLTMLGIAEAANDHTLILISLMGNATLLLVTLIGAVVTWLTNRDVKLVKTEVAKVAELPAEVKELRKNTDGILSKLETARQETSIAKQESAHAAGVQQERIEARVRTDANDAIIAKVEIVNKPSEPVPTTPMKAKPKD